MAAEPDPRILAATLAAFVDTLLPGDADFPSASSAGTQGLLANRIRERLGNDAFPRIVEILNAEGDFAAACVDERNRIVARFADDERDLFHFMRFATYFAYYELPPVVATLQQLGYDYNDAPQPLGYTLPPFDPAINIPREPRGTYKRTEEITRLDLSSLADLHLPAGGN